MLQVLIQQLVDILMNGVSERSYTMQLTSPTSPSKTSFTGSSFQSSSQLLDRGYVFKYSVIFLLGGSCLTCLAVLGT
jgi:hypothetical protein